MDRIVRVVGILLCIHCKRQVCCIFMFFSLLNIVLSCDSILILLDNHLTAFFDEFDNRLIFLLHSFECAFFHDFYRLFQYSSAEYTSVTSNIVIATFSLKRGLSHDERSVLRKLFNLFIEFMCFICWYSHLSRYLRCSYFFWLNGKRLFFGFVFFLRKRNCRDKFYGYCRCFFSIFN